MPRPRRLVVDSNGLKSDALVDFLSTTPRHTVVLCEWVLMELFQHKRAMETVRLDLAILSKFSGQVFLTKSLNELNHLPTRKSGLSDRIIDHHRTSKFRGFCQKLYRNPTNIDLNQTLAENMERVDRRMAEATTSAGFLPELFQRISRDFSHDELRMMASKHPHSHDIHRKFADRVFSLTQILTAEVVSKDCWPETRADAANHFLFRYAVCAMVLYLRWVEGGRQPILKVSNVKNDLIDANVAATSTFFHGVVSDDRKLNHIHTESRYLVHAFGGHIP